MIYVANAFSLQMLQGGVYFMLEAVKRPVEAVAEHLRDQEFVSAIGHADTARIVSGLLGISIPSNRASVTLSRDDVLIVAQYTGPRLPEGATTLPEGAQITFWRVRLV